MNAEPHHNSRDDHPLSLSEQSPDFYAYVESDPSAILITNTRGEIQYVNGAWQRLTGYSKHEVLGKNPSFLNSGKTGRRLYEELWASLKKGNSFESDEFIDKRKDGSEFSLHAVFFPVKLLKDATYFVQVLQDVTHKKEIEKQRDTFISAASHELRSPLSTMVFSLDLLKHELKVAPEATKETLGTLSSAMDRFKTLVAYLLDVNKIHMHALMIHKKRTNLLHVIQRTIAEMQVLFPSHTLVLEFKGDHLFAAFDEARIAQVLINLISNAVKYSPEANRVIIRLTKEGGFLKVSVQDFGIGVPKEEQVKIFGILYRAKNKGSIQGTGLGLYISAQILAAHNAALEVESEVGGGIYVLLLATGH